MIEKIYRNHTKKIIALLLVLSIIFVYIIGNSFGGLVALERYKNSISHNTSKLGMNYIDSDRELNLAETVTELGKTSELLKDGYIELANSYGNEDNFKIAVDDFSLLVTSLKESTTLELDKTDNDSTEYDEYRSVVLSSFDELEVYISELSTDNADILLSKIKEKVAEEKPYLTLAGDLPFGEVSIDNVSFATFSEISNDYSPQNTNYNQSNLEITNDTILNDKIRSEFEELDSVLDIYQFVKNNYITEFYYGSRKGAIGTYEQKAGNDYDQASLLIGILRDRGIPTRYVQGEIEITAEQAMEWTATDNINVALRIMSSLGTPVTGLTVGDKIVAVRVEHVWVEAYVPYTDYRGAGNQSGESLWIPLDPSFKEVYYHDGLNIAELEDYLNDESNHLTKNSEINGVGVGNITSLLDGQESAFVKYLLENGYGNSTAEEVFGGREVIFEDLGYLPLTLPYSVSKKINSFDDVPLNLTDSITFSLIGNSAFDLNFDGLESINKTLYTPDIYGKRLVLSYIPASDTDSGILDKYDGIFKTPAYLLKLKPQLLLDGVVVAEGLACNAGYTQKYTIKTHNGSRYTNDATVTNSITVGGIYCIALDYGTISADTLQNSADYMDALESTISEANIYTDTAMGEMLNSIAKTYFAQLDIYNSIVAGQNNVTSTRDISIGIVGFNINVIYTFNRPAELNEGGIFLDIGRDVHSVISNDGNNESEKMYMLQAGIYASAMEHSVLEQATGVESVSTIKTFSYAVENNIPIHTIAKENLSSELAIINVSESTKQDIRSAVNSGKVVIIPEREITINQWYGVGYMVLDTDTFACGYMISGGMAGGSMTVELAILEYILYVLQALPYMCLFTLCYIGLILVASPLLPAFIALMAVTACVGAFFAGWSIGTHIYNGFANGDSDEFWYAFIETAGFVTLLGIGNAMGKIVNKTLTPENIAVAQGQAEQATAKGGACFVAGTLIATSFGFVPIETIKAGDMVQSFNPKTQIVSEKVVEEAFIRESTEFIHVKVSNETITTTPEHPFYVAQKGFTNSVDLRAGDILCTVNGEYVIVEQVQHEIIELPIKVYNFRVADNHTYFVSDIGVGVHNANCVETTEKLPNQGKVTGNVEDAPNVDAGKQGKHVSSHNNYNPNKSTWANESNGVVETQQGWLNGFDAKGGTKVWDTGKIVGTNGETGVRVHIDGQGNLHGYPVFVGEYLP